MCGRQTEEDAEAKGQGAVTASSQIQFVITSPVEPRTQ